MRPGPGVRPGTLHCDELAEQFGVDVIDVDYLHPQTQPLYHVHDPATEPDAYSCVTSNRQHPSNTVGAKGPTGSRGIRTGYERAVDDLFVTDHTTMPTPEGQNPTSPAPTRST